MKPYKPVYDSQDEEKARQSTEITRLSAALKKANEQAEHFEREWYLRGDEIESLQQLLADARTFVAFAYANGVMGAEECGRRIEAATTGANAGINRSREAASG